MIRACLLVLVAGLLPSCGDTGRHEVSFPFHAGGTAVTSFEDDGWTITITEARIAFGPAYFCATPTADLDLCGTAVAEMRESVAVDVLAAPDALGEVHALTGTVRSAMWDHGLTFLLPDEAPTPTAGAIDGHSAHFAGTVDRDAEHVVWTADVDVAARVSGAPAVRAVRTMHEITSANDALSIVFDPAAILARVDWSEVAAGATDGAARIEPGTVPHDAIVIAMTSSALPTIEWGAP